MHRAIISGIAIMSLWACGPATQYSWQDSYQPAREDATADLEECKAYSAAQYQPGMPAGSPYLDDYGGYPHGFDLSNSVNQPSLTEQKEWRPDRDPVKSTHISSMPIHHVPVDYTGYPGELDYYPGYLDAILEKCMNDRGWFYKPTEENADTK